jgi:hypothetical protein
MWVGHNCQRSSHKYLRKAGEHLSEHGSPKYACVSYRRNKNPSTAQVEVMAPCICVLQAYWLFKGFPMFPLSVSLIQKYHHFQFVHMATV